MDVQDFLKVTEVILEYMIVSLPAAHQRCGFFGVNNIRRKLMKKNTLILFLIILMILYATKFANAMIRDGALNHPVKQQWSILLRMV